MGALKPEEKIYEALEELSDLNGDEIIYLDDRSENCAAGSERGWQVCCHQDVESSRRFLSNVGELSLS